MDNNSFTSYAISDRSFVAYAKREIHLWAGKCRFTASQLGEIDIIVSELCSNLVKHASGGELLVRITPNTPDIDLFEILCIDRGKGFDDASKMMRDGFSTTQTLGHGLGSLARLSDSFQIFSKSGSGTILYATKYSAPVVQVGRRQFDIKAVCVPKQTESVCGDGYEVKMQPGLLQILFGDGLGHGQPAYEVINEAREIFRSTNEPNPAEMLRSLHAGLRKSRGAVCTVATLNLKSNEWSICGVGNIMTRLYDGITYKNYMSYNGVVGLNVPKVLMNSTPAAEKNQRLIMCSDGIRSGWDLSRYPGIFRYDNAIIAACIKRDFSRETDDTSVLLATII